MAQNLDYNKSYSLKEIYQEYLKVFDNKFKKNYFTTYINKLARKQELFKKEDKKYKVV